MNDILEPRSGAAYQEKFVAFVDILGFRELVIKAHTDPEKRASIVDALETVYETKPPTKGETGLQAQYFSDSLILSADATPDGLWHLLLTLDRLSWNLLSGGILCRGGVAKGGVYHDGRIVFGTGVNEAYDLESKRAKSPRIILSRRVVSDAFEFAGRDEVSAGYAARLVRDDDGVWFINYLSDLSAFAHQDAPLATLRGHPWYLAGETIRERLQRQLDDLVEEPEVYGKLAWLARFWNRRVAGSTGDREPTFPRLRLAGEGPIHLALPFRGA